VTPHTLPDLVASVPGLATGRTVTSQENPSAGPLLWISERPAIPGDWARLAALHTTTGLWPVLLEGLDNDVERPWLVGEFVPSVLSGTVDVEEFLAGEFAGAFEDDEEWPDAPAWPGLSPVLPPVVPAEEGAAEFADDLLAFSPGMHLGLVQVERGADVLARLGWMGAVNYDAHPQVLSGVLRSWEERFSARLVGLGFDTVYLSVSAPPTDPAQALPVAAEHLGFCYDAIMQDGPGDLAEYAADLVDRGGWRFWFD